MIFGSHLLTLIEYGFVFQQQFGKKKQAEAKNSFELCYLQKRVLNVSRGPAVRALHAQTDKQEYAMQMKNVVERNIQFFGLDSQQKVTSSYVVVIGLGGVGSHAASMLLRSRVGKLLLVDFDQVRHRLRKDHGIEGGIPVVFSLEKPKAQLLPFRGPSGEEDNPSDYQCGNSSNILKLNLK
ncbi:hypothetical protein V6Z11_D13G138500 [Gossypium hirsutum]